MPAARPGKEGGGGPASKLFNKFDSDRKYDPFLDTDPVIQDSKEGMEALLSMCNAVEINSLFGALGFVVPCPRAAKEQQIMKYIRDGGRQVEKKFADVLKFCWEGLLYEYLRTVGCPLRDREHDPRHFVMRYWRRSMLDPSVQPGFVPFYAKREIKKRSNIMQEDRDIRDIRAGLILRENLVKEAEARTRGQHDYRFVLQYFSASRNLHGTLVANVNYLANEVEQLRANMDHNSESISIMEQQFVELETKYDRVVGGLVHRGAFQLTLESSLYGVIHEGHAALKTAERKANVILGSMETGPERYDSVDDEAVFRETAVINNSIGGTDATPKNAAASAAAAGTVATGSPQNSGVDGQETEEDAMDPKDKGGAKWAAPRSQADSRKNLGSGNQEPEGNDFGVDNGGKGDTYLSMEPCLGQVLQTHRRACKRYANQVAELEAQNAGLALRAAEASRLEREAVEQAKLWAAKHDALAERLTGVEKRAREDLDLAEERAAEARSRSLEAAGEMREKLERATPTLLELVAGFAPRDTEGPGLDLFRSLGIEPDLYVHLVATKRMFEADLESRAFEVIDAERKIAAAEATKQEEAAAAAATAAGGKKKKGERGRPKTRGKGGGEKAKSVGSKSKSRSKSAPAKGAKKAPEKSGAKGAQGGAGKDKDKKAVAERKPTPADKARASSPAKKGAAGKGAAGKGAKKKK